MASPTTPTYQAITILSLLIAAGILVFMAIVYTQNKSKWEVIDTAQKSLMGPISQLKLGHPSPTASASLSVQGKPGPEQFSMFAQDNPSRANAPYFSITSPAGRADIPLPIK